MGGCGHRSRLDKPPCLFAWIGIPNRVNAVWQRAVGVVGTMGYSKICTCGVTPAFCYSKFPFLLSETGLKVGSCDSDRCIFGLGGSGADDTQESSGHSRETYKSLTVG